MSDLLPITLVGVMGLWLIVRTARRLHVLRELRRAYDRDGAQAVAVRGKSFHTDSWPWWLS